MALTLLEHKSAIVRDPLVVSPNTPLAEAISHMSDASCLNSPPQAANTQLETVQLETLHRGSRASCVVVVEADRVVGILTERDVVRLSACRLPGMAEPTVEENGLTVGQAMTRPVFTLRESAVADLFWVINFLQQRCIRHLPILDDQDRLVGLVTPDSLLPVLSSQQDITRQQLKAELHAQQRIETCLLESEQRYASLVAAAPVGIFRHDALGNCIYVNDRCCQLAGLPPETLVGDRWRMALHPDDRDRVVIEWEKSIRENYGFQLEYRLQHPDGSVKWVHTQSVAEQDAQGQVIGYVGAIADISDRKRAEDLLRENERRVRRAIANAPFPMMIHAEDGEVLQINAAWTELTGYTRSDIPTTQAWAERAYGSDAARVLENIIAKKYALESRWDEGEFTITTRSGSQKIWRFSSVPLGPLPDGRRAVISMAADVTQSRRTEMALRHSEAQSQAVLSAIPDLMFRVGADGVYRGYVTHHRELDLLPQTVNPTGSFMGDTLPAEVTQRHLQAIQRALETGELQVYEQQVQIGDRLQDEEVRVIQSGPDEVLFIIRDISDRKQAEAERLHTEHIRKELTLLEQILDIVLAGYWDWDIPNHREYLSPGFKRMFGYADHELPNSPESWQDLIFPEDLPEVLDCFDRHVQSKGKVPYYNQVRYRHKDGSTVWVICSGQVIEWDTSGNPIRMIGCHIDISDLKRAETELQASRAYYKGIIADQTELICRFLPDGVLTFVNDAYCEFFQKSPEELLGKSFTPLIPEVDRDIPLQNINKLSIDNPVATCEHRVIAPNGSINWQQWTDRALFDPEGNFIEFQAVGRDITALKAAEERLRQLSMRLNLAVKSADIGIWDWDIPRDILHWDHRMYELYGKGAKNANNMYEALSSSLHPDDLLAAETAIQKALLGEQDFDVEFRIIHPNGAIRFLKAKALVQFTPEGQPQRMIGINYDITDRKHTENQLQQYTAQLEASNRELEAFAYSVSHDLRAPLRAINGFSKALLEDYGDAFDEEAQDYFGRIRHNVNRMGLLIDDLLNLSRVARSEIIYTAVNLSGLAQELIAEWQTLEPQRTVEVAVAPGVIVYADATLMRVVLTNLLHNAWKFTSQHPTACIEFGLMHSNGQPTYFVRDDGAGFDMAYANKLFGVFQRLHGTHEFPGTGIGLATVQRAIQRLGGRIWAESVIERGTTFYFTVPNPPLLANELP